MADLQKTPAHALRGVNAPFPFQQCHRKFCCHRRRPVAKDSSGSAQLANMAVMGELGYFAGVVSRGGSGAIEGGTAQAVPR